MLFSTGTVKTSPYRSEELEILHRDWNTWNLNSCWPSFATGIAGDRSIAQDLTVREIQPQRSPLKGRQLRVWSVCWRAVIRGPGRAQLPTQAKWLPHTWLLPGKVMDVPAHPCASTCLSLELSSVRAGTVLPGWGAVPIDPPAVQPLYTKAMLCTTTAQHRRAQMASEELLPQTCILRWS